MSDDTAQDRAEQARITAKARQWGPPMSETRGVEEVTKIICEAYQPRVVGDSCIWPNCACKGPRDAAALLAARPTLDAPRKLYEVGLQLGWFKGAPSFNEFEAVDPIGFDEFMAGCDKITSPAPSGGREMEGQQSVPTMAHKLPDSVIYAGADKLKEMKPSIEYRHACDATQEMWNAMLAAFAAIRALPAPPRTPGG